MPLQQQQGLRSQHLVMGGNPERAAACTTLRLFVKSQPLGIRIADFANSLPDLSAFCACHVRDEKQQTCAAKQKDAAIPREPNDDKQSGPMPPRRYLGYSARYITVTLP